MSTQNSVAIALTPGPTTAPAPAAPGVTHSKLDNGMEIVVIPDPRTPVVTHMVWYKNGSADDPLGKSGIAHFLEHLMLLGSLEHQMFEKMRYARLAERIVGGAVF